jgi:hypothetical protein
MEYLSEQHYNHGVILRIVSVKVLWGEINKVLVRSASSYSFPILSRVGMTCFSSCCDKDSVIIFTTGRLPDVNPSAGPTI